MSTPRSPATARSTRRSRRRAGARVDLGGDEHRCRDRSGRGARVGADRARARGSGPLAKALHVEVTNISRFAELPTALEKFDEIVRIEDAVGNHRGAVDTLGNRVFFELMFGRVDDALRDVQRMKELSARVGDTLGRTLKLEAWALQERGEVAKAVARAHHARP